MLNHLFVDMNAYFASVEQQLRPELRNRPVVVAAVLVDSTCCIAASYEAKALGIKTGTSVRQARELCPHVQVVEARPEIYVRCHHKILAAVESCIPIERVHSVDEASCRLWGAQRQPERALALARQVKQAIRDKVGACLRCSIGLAPNAFLAKVASDMQKPDGLTLLTPQDLPYKLYPLALNDLPGIGPRMLRRLHSYGVGTVEQLCALPEKRLGEIWQGVVGRRWWYWLRGHDLPELPTRRQSISHSHVLPPALRTRQGAYAVLVRLIHKVAARLRRLNYWASTMSVYVSFSYREEGWQGSVALGQCRDTLTMLEALAALWPSLPLGEHPTQVAVTLHRLVAAGNASQPIFSEMRDRLRLADAMDRVNRAFGSNAVYFGAMHQSRDSAPTRIGFTSVPDLDNWEEEEEEFSVAGALAAR